MSLAVVSVAGATSRAGKTALAEACLAALPDGTATAVKFTTTEDVFERCPRGTRCTVCDLDRPWRRIGDPAVLGEPGTDTDRLARAGATRVVWVIARRSAAAAAWASVSADLDGAAVVEGSSVVAHARPRLLLFVVHPQLDPRRWKPGSAELIRRADVVVLNAAHGPGGTTSEATIEAVRRARGRDDARVADVRRPLGEWAPELRERLAALADGTPPAPAPSGVSRRPGAG